MKKPKKQEPVHLISHMTFAAIWTLCEQGMQQGGEGSEWHSDVNCWGRTGIVKTKGWKLATIDPALVTCPACKARMKHKRRGRREGEERNEYRRDDTKRPAGGRRARRS